MSRANLGGRPASRANRHPQGHSRTITTAGLSMSCASFLLVHVGRKPQCPVSTAMPNKQTRASATKGACRCRCLDDSEPGLPLWRAISLRTSTAWGTLQSVAAKAVDADSFDSTQAATPPSPHAQGRLACHGARTQDFLKGPSWDQTSMTTSCLRSTDDAQPRGRARRRPQRGYCRLAERLNRTCTVENAASHFVRFNVLQFNGTRAVGHNGCSRTRRPSFVVYFAVSLSKRDRIAHH